MSPHSSGSIAEGSPLRAGAQQGEISQVQGPQLLVHPVRELLAVFGHAPLVQALALQTAQHQVVEAVDWPVVLGDVVRLHADLAAILQAILEVLDGLDVLVVQLHQEVEQGLALLLELSVGIGREPGAAGQEHRQLLARARGVLGGVADQRVDRVGHDRQADVGKDHEEERRLRLALRDPGEGVEAGGIPRAAVRVQGSVGGHIAHVLAASLVRLVVLELQVLGE
mmetsp:Transcript_20725/g.47214  ORF Transcript_20725/g.47214 Transcript_20725/m.47214 type:complete len:225 (-) Transcript_20725:482-1156(-)